MSPLQHEYLVYLFLAYTALFVIMFGFMFRMLKKSRQLDQDVKLIKEEWLGQVSDADAGNTEMTSPVVPTVRGHGMQDA